jgi:DNA-binding transcriptional regulator YiaG
MGGFVMNTKPQKTYHYKACGLDNVYLMNGFYIEETEYGPVISFEDIEGLHGLIAHRLVNHDHELSGKEFRFLRKELELSQKEIARLLGCDEQQIGRWERGEHKMAGSADRLIRLLYQENYSKNPHVRDLLERIATLVQEEEQMQLADSKLCFQRDSDEWKLAA